MSNCWIYTVFHHCIYYLPILLSNLSHSQFDSIMSLYLQAFQIWYAILVWNINNSIPSYFYLFSEKYLLYLVFKTTAEHSSMWLNRNSVELTLIQGLLMQLIVKDLNYLFHKFIMNRRTFPPGYLHCKISIVFIHFWLGFFITECLCKWICLLYLFLSQKTECFQGVFRVEMYLSKVLNINQQKSRHLMQIHRSKKKVLLRIIRPNHKVRLSAKVQQGTR